MPLSAPFAHRRLNVKGLLIAIGLPVVLVGALVATLLGTGAFSRDSELEDESLWLWTTPAGEIARVNGLTAATDARFELTDAAGNAVQIVQTDSHLLLREIVSGKVSAIDLTTLALTGSAETTPGEGVRLALHDEGAFIIDQTQGLVNQVDPSTLAAIGDPLQFPAGLTGGAFDKSGKLWVGVPREGTIVQIEPKDQGAKTVATEVVAEPRQELALTVLGDGVAVLNSTAKQMTTLRSDGRRSVTDVELAGPAETAETSPGTIASVTVTDPPSVITVNDEESQRFAIAAAPSNLLGASVEFHQRIYVPDGASGLVWVYDLDGKELDRIEIDAGGGPVEMYHTGDTLFANALNTNAAVVVSANGNARQAEKDRDDILGGNAPPPEAEDEPGDEGNGDEGEGSESEEGGEAAEPSAPGAVTNLTGVGGDRSVSLSWNAASRNGSAISKYVIEGAGRTWEVAPNQRSLEVDGLTNLQAYTFTVTAHNAIGSGPAATSLPIVPTSALPDPVASVSAVANADGTVDLSWPAAGSEGPAVTGYQIESVGGDGSGQVMAETAGTSHTFTAGELRYGTGYMFTVRTLAGGAAAEPSPQSPSVTPYNVPDAPGSLEVTTEVDTAGTVEAEWGQPESNGRPIDHYVVTANGESQDVTGTKVLLDGFADGETVEVSVAAVNAAGESQQTTGSASTVAVPTVAIEVRSTSGASARLDVTAEDGGGTITCDFETTHNYDRETHGDTTQVYQIMVEKPCTVSSFRGTEGVTFTVEVTIENAAGTGTDEVTFTL
ncbi:fibronectin type III domain-containing protein [Glycomyces sp. NPDC021274]|uniref:fibronectin type III domain-containing protein n=1 Tax=Glycomyces sp. NPDC021274 TaxID=3155120 RepID=UPI0033CCAD04